MDQSVFSIDFQYGALKLLLSDELLFIQTSKWLDKNPFNNDELWWFYSKASDYYKNYQKLPGEIFYSNEINYLTDMAIKEKIVAIYNRITQTPDADYGYIRKQLKEFIKHTLLNEALKHIKNDYQSNTQDVALAKLGKRLGEISQVNFEDKDYYVPEDTLRIIMEQPDSLIHKVQTGLAAVDEALNGGAGEGEVFTVLARDGVGKSMFLMNVGARAVQSGKRVLHIHCEGKRIQPIQRYCSRLTGIEYNKILKKNLTPEDIELIKQYEVDSKDRLIIKPFLGIDKFKGAKSSHSIEDLMDFCMTIHPSFPFDVLIVDYGDKLGTREKVEQKRFVWTNVWQGLEAIAAEFAIPVFTASQAVRVRSGKNKALRREDMAESMDKSRLSSFVLSINREHKDITESQVRYMLDKDREGPTGLLIIAKSDYTVCNTHLDGEQRLLLDSSSKEQEESNGEL